MPVEVVGWGPDVSAAIDRAESLAYLAVFGVVFIGAVVVVLLVVAALGPLVRP